MYPESASCDWSTKSVRLRDSCEGLIDACGGDAISNGTGDVNDPPYPEVGGDAVGEKCGYDIDGEPLAMD